MNSGGSKAGGLSGSGVRFERDDSPAARERDGEEAAALWVALAQQVTQTQSAPIALADGAQSTTPNAWRSSAGDLTPGAPMTATADAAAAPAEASERMVLRVDGGALGELEVTLDRKDGALRVVIGMENQHLVGSVLPDARLLQSALERAGINVQSLNVVPASEVGTVLAQPRTSPTGLKADAASGGQPQEPEKAQKRNHKRLTLIG